MPPFSLRFRADFFISFPLKRNKNRETAGRKDKQANGRVYLPDEAYTKPQVESLNILPSDISAGNYFYKNFYSW